MSTTRQSRVRTGCYAIAGLLLAGCGSESSSGGTSISAPVETVSLDVSIGTQDGPDIATASLTVDSDGTARGTSFLTGDAAQAAAAVVAEPAGRNRLLNGESTDLACTDVYGGPDVATVTGSIDGHKVATSFHRSNGCGLADWGLMQALIGRPRWDVDQRVFHRDEAGIEVSVGGRFSIELPSNATTGYAWEATVLDGAVLREVDHFYLPPVTTLVGAGGYERFAYEATGSGTTAITFEYRRPSEPPIVTPEDTARFDVGVSGTPATTSTSASTTIAATTSSAPEGSLAPMPANAAGQELARFVDAVRALHEGVQPLLDEAAGLPVGEQVPPSVTQLAAGAVDEFYTLAARISDGLDPAVRTAAVDVVFALGREIAPFLFAPGWESDGWDIWASGVEDARVEVPETVARLADEAVLHPDAAPEDPIGAEGAAFHGGLDVLIVRGFGHANFNTQPPWSVRWVGGLPSDPAETTCFVDGQPSSVGTFVDQQGGCAVLYYDTADPAEHDDELATWLADPTFVPTFIGEVITIRWTNGAWVGIGSAE